MDNFGNDEKNAFKLRNELSRFGFGHGDIYKLSLKFAGILKASEIKGKFDKISKSLHYSVKPQENYALAMEVLLDETTISEAIKKSMIKKSENEIKSFLGQYDWAKNHLDAIALKYAGEKTPHEILNKFNLLLKEIPYLENPQENSKLALEVLLDRKNITKIENKKKRVEFICEIRKSFGDLADDLLFKITDKYFGQVTAQKLFASSMELLKDLGYDQKKENYILALKILTGEVTKEESILQLRKKKNKQIISMLASEFSLSANDSKVLTDKYCLGPKGCWFDEEFSHIFTNLHKYPACRKKNTYLTLQVLLGKIDKTEAIDISRIYKNTYLIGEYETKFSLSKEEVFKLASIYTKENTPALLDRDISQITKDFKRLENLWDLVILASLKYLVGEISRQKVTLLADFYSAFDKFSISKEDLEKITNKFLGIKNPREAAEIFGSIIAELPYTKSREENYALAVEVLLDGSSDAFKRTLKQTQVLKEKALFKEEISKYGWFGGYTSEITDKFFPHKSSGEVIADYENILGKIDTGQRRELYCDIALKALLGKISTEEALAKANTRKILSSADWAKGFVREIEDNYLGIKSADEIIEYLGERFKKYTFWRDNKLAHKFIIDKTILELNSETSAEINLLSMMLLNDEVPPNEVDKIGIFLQKELTSNFDPKIVYEKYMQIYGVLGNHTQASDGVIEYLKLIESGKN